MALTCRKEIGISMDEFTTHSCCRQLPQRVSLVALARINRDLFYFVDCHYARSPEGLDDNLTADTLFHMLLDFFENLACQYHDGRCTVSNFGIL